MFTRHMTMYLWQKVMVVLFFFLHHYFCISHSSEPNLTRVEERTEEEQTKVSNFFFQLRCLCTRPVAKHSLCYRFHHYYRFEHQLTSETTGTTPVYGSRFFFSSCSVFHNQISSNSRLFHLQNQHFYPPKKGATLAK